MTIIRPSRNKFRLRNIVLGCFMVLIFAAFYIYEYSAASSARHAVEDLREAIVLAEEENALLKREVYTLSDPSRLAEFARSTGMVMEHKPTYLSLQSVESLE